MRSRCCLCALLFLAFAVPAGADVNSGPTANEKVPPVKVFAATGPNEKKELDYAADRADKPTIYIVIQADKFDRPMARFIKILDGKVKKVNENAYIVAVWLTEDQDKIKEHLPRIQQSIQLEATALTVFAGDKNGPKDWNINTDAHVTVVIANKQKVATTIGYLSINDTDVPKVEEALKKAVK